MKRFRRGAAVLVVAAVFCLLTFAGCEKKEGASLTGGMTIVIAPDSEAATAIDVDLAGYTETDSVMDVIDGLAEAQKICYKGSNGVYGMYLTALGVPAESTEGGQTEKYDRYILEEDVAAKRSLYTYTSVDADKLETEAGASYTAKTVEYEGVLLTESVNSVSRMQICDGAIVYFTYLYWD